MFTDRELIRSVVLMVLVDILVMSLWTGVDRPISVTTTLHSQVGVEAQSDSKYLSEGRF